ncbi:hypothetical protein ACIPW5_06995 [Streptomyces sp. NPDC090077]|uniref:hypothetical protein n=1 Tax=Streptomyces sp. NPDC090077 TaxID=3365938 RepID=UPI0037FB7EC2
MEIGDVTLLDAIPIPLLDFVPGLLKAACQVKRSANAKISFTEHEEYIDLEPAGDCLIISFGPDLQVECSRGEFILEAVRFSEEAFWHLVNIHPELRRNPFVVSISQLLESGL